MPQPRTKKRPATSKDGQPVEALKPQRPRRGRSVGALVKYAPRIGADGKVGNPVRLLLDSLPPEAIPGVCAQLVEIIKTALARIGADLSSPQARKLATLWRELTEARLEPGSRAHLFSVAWSARSGSREPAGVEVGLLLRKIALIIGELSHDKKPGRSRWQALQAIEAFLRGDFSQMQGCEDLKQLREEQFGQAFLALLQAVSRPDGGAEFFRGLCAPPASQGPRTSGADSATSGVLGHLAMYAFDANVKGQIVRVADARQWLENHNVRASTDTIRRVLRGPLKQTIEPGKPGAPRRVKA